MERGSFGDILYSSKRVFLVLHAKYLIIPFLEYPPKYLIFRMCKWQLEIST